MIDRKATPEVKILLMILNSYVARVITEDKHIQVSRVGLKA